MIHSDKNLSKELKKATGDSIEQIAKTLGMSRQNLTKELKRRPIKYEFNLKLKDKYGLYIKESDGTVSLQILSQDVNISSKVFDENIKTPMLANKSENHENLNLTIVPLKAYGGFLRGYSNRVFMDSLKHASFPFINGECWSFEVDGLSMYPELIPGDHIVCTKVEKLEWMTKGRVYVYQTVDGIIIKQFDHIDGEDFIHLKNINPEIPEPKPIYLKDIKVVYYKEYLLRK